MFEFWFAERNRSEETEPAAEEQTPPAAKVRRVSMATDATFYPRFASSSVTLFGLTTKFLLFDPSRKRKPPKR